MMPSGQPDIGIVDRIFTKGAEAREAPRSDVFLMSYWPSITWNKELGKWNDIKNTFATFPDVDQ